MDKWVKSFNSAEGLSKILKKLPKKMVIVYTYGAWDLLHPGHIRLLLQAKALGDFLIAGVVGDKPVRQLKGSGRPVQPLKDRLFNIAALRCVDAAIPQKSYNPSPELTVLKRIDILAKGNDWDKIPGEETVNAIGGKLIKLRYSHGFSTSELISRISGKPKAKHGEPKC